MSGTNLKKKNILTNIHLSSCISIVTWLDCVLQECSCCCFVTIGATEEPEVIPDPAKQTDWLVKVTGISIGVLVFIMLVLVAILLVKKRWATAPTCSWNNSGPVFNRLIPQQQEATTVLLHQFCWFVSVQYFPWRRHLSSIYHIPCWSPFRTRWTIFWHLLCCNKQLKVTSMSGGIYFPK